MSADTERLRGMLADDMAEALYEAPLAWDFFPDSDAAMTISDDGDLLNWRGVNYVRQRPRELSEPEFDDDERFALRWLIRWVALFAFLVGAIAGAVLQGVQ